MALQHLTHLPPSISLEDLDVVMSNALIRSAHDLILSEKRLVAACLGKTAHRTWPAGFHEAIGDLTSKETLELHKQNWNEWTTKLPESPFSVRLSAADYAAAYDLDKSQAYEQMEKAAQKLSARQITMQIHTPQGIDTYKFPWTQGVYYSKGSGFIELFWSFDVAQHVFGQVGSSSRKGKGQYTKYKLKEAARFDSIYSWRLFEILMSLKGGVYTVAIDTFLLAMDAPAGYSKDFYTVRRRIIDVAIAELKVRNGMVITYEEQRAGKKIVGLIFRYEQDAPGIAYDGEDRPDTDAA